MQYRRNHGFTLVELLIAMAMASLVMAAIVSAYQIQVRGMNTQEALTDMNQTARAALEVMTHEIRMAGCDPTRNADTRIITADTGELVFSLDVDNDSGNNQADGDCCDPNEAIRYHLTNDANDDGENDDVGSGGQSHLGRETGEGLVAACPGGGTSGLQPLARNVDALNFVYFDSDGNQIPTPVADTEEIRRIEITLVARAGETSGGFLYSYTNSNAYTNLQGVEVLSQQDDSFRRLRLATTVYCRNNGL